MCAAQSVNGHTTDKVYNTSTIYPHKISSVHGVPHTWFTQHKCPNNSVYSSVVSHLCLVHIRKASRER